MSYQFEVTPHDEGRRLDSLLRSRWPALPLGAMMKYFRKGQVRVDGKRADYKTRVCAGSQVYVPWESPEAVGRERGADGTTHLGKLDVLYQDDYVLVVDKPAGLLSQPDSPGEDSLTTRALAYAKADYLPQLCHRLDRNTSGVVMLARDGRALREMMALFKARRVDKKYLALVCGQAPKQGRIDAPLLKDSDKKLVRVDPAGESALTTYRRIDGNGELSLLEVTLHSGRTHQIRAHLNHAGLPLVGDRKYGDFSRKKELKALGAKRPMLHALSLALGEVGEPMAHLSGKKWVAPLSGDFKKLVLDLGLNFSVNEGED